MSVSGVQPSHASPDIQPLGEEEKVCQNAGLQGPGPHSDQAITWSKTRRGRWFPTENISYLDKCWYQSVVTSAASSSRHWSLNSCLFPGSPEIGVQHSNFKSICLSNNSLSGSSLTTSCCGTHKKRTGPQVMHASKPIHFFVSLCHGTQMTFVP